MFLVGILFGFVPVYLNSIGYDPFNAGLVLSAGTLAYLAVQPPAGCWADRYGARIIVIIGSVVSSLSTVFLVFTQSLLFVALVVLGGLGIGVVWTNCDAIMSNLAEAGGPSRSLSWHNLPVLRPDNSVRCLWYYGACWHYPNCVSQRLLQQATMITHRSADHYILLDWGSAMSNPIGQNVRS